MSGHISRRRRSPQSRRNLAGVGLIEVLIAVLLLAIGLLGIAALQAVTLKNAGSSSGRTQAMLHMYGMADTLRVNKNRLAEFNTGGFSCSETYSGGSNPNTDLAHWLQNLADNVAPTACGRVNCADGTTCTVGVRWDDSRGTGADATPIVISADIRL